MLDVSPLWVETFLLVLARVGAVVMLTPGLGGRGVPTQVKAGLAIVLSLLFVSLQAPRLSAGGLGDGLGPLVIGVARELLVGLLIGFAVSLVFAMAQVAAAVVGVQLGFGIGAVIDPISGAQGPVLEQFYVLLATLVFFSMNGHHQVVLALQHTFQAVPLDSFDITKVGGGTLVALVQSAFDAGLRIALPVVAALLLTDVGMGIVARAAPQVNILVVGFPVKLIVGLLLLAVSLPATVALLHGLLAGLGGDMLRALRT